MKTAWTWIVAAGCLAAGRAPAADLPVVFIEDFEQGADRWEILRHPEDTQPPNWRVDASDKGRSFHQFAPNRRLPGPHRGPFNVAVLKDPVFEDFVFEADVKSTGLGAGPDHRDVVFVFGFRDLGHFHYMHIGRRRDSNSCRIHVVDNAPRRAIDEKALVEGTPWTDGWHRIRVVLDARARTVTLYFDDMEKPHMRAENLAFPWGRVGIGSFDDMSMWDNIRIRGKVRNAGGGSTATDR